MHHPVKILFFFFLYASAFSQPGYDFLPYDAEKMAWFSQAKLGIFIHWGIYAVDGTTESWAFFNNEVSYDQYMAQAKGFTARNYQPDTWAALFKEAGARYAVLTAKHHDGVALWDSKYSDLTVVKMTPAGKDLIVPYCKAMEKAGLKTGLYFSHLDWSHPDYASVVPRHIIFEDTRNSFAYPPKGQENILRWERFLHFHRGQIKELCITYKPDLLWFDGTWERDPEQWNMKTLRDSIDKWNPKIIVNSRMMGYGNYDTPEQVIPIVRPQTAWELCMTMNNSWGYRQSDTNYKSIREIIRTFAECIGNGGNLLLDIGPMEDGTIPAPQIERLKAIGAWIKKHEEAVYPTVAGMPYGHFSGPATYTKDSSIIYLYLFDQALEYIPVKGIRNKIKQIRVVGTTEVLTWKKSGGAKWINVPGTLLIDVPRNIDPYLTVIAIELENKLDLYHGIGHKEDVYCNY